MLPAQVNPELPPQRAVLLMLKALVDMAMAETTQRSEDRIVYDRNEWTPVAGKSGRSSLHRDCCGRPSMYTLDIALN